MFSEVEKLLAGCKYDRAEIGSLKVPVGTSAIANEILRLVITSI